MRLQRTRRSVRRAAPAHHSMFHVLTWRGLWTLLDKLKLPFVRLMIIWFVAFIAISAVLTMLPLALIILFGVSTRLPPRLTFSRRRPCQLRRCSRAGNPHLSASTHLVDVT